jgi:hypothetical protein
MSEAANTADARMACPGAQRLIGHPDDVVRNPDMSLADKREVLARWASDAHAVENAPALRQLDDGSVVEVDGILRALRALDEAAGTGAPQTPGWTPYPHKRGAFLSRLRTGRGRRPDDDDPPPRPALAAVPVKIVVTDALAA